MESSLLINQAADQRIDQEICNADNNFIYTWQQMMGTSPNNIPVSTSMLVNTPEVAGIYWVATGKAQREKGCGELVTWHAVREALQKGYNTVILQGSAMGEPIYQRMGFETICRYQLWTFDVK